MSSLSPNSNDKVKAMRENSKILRSIIAGFLGLGVPLLLISVYMWSNFKPSYFIQGIFIILALFSIISAFLIGFGVKNYTINLK
jgi:hypothetical protein